MPSSVVPTFGANLSARISGQLNTRAERIGAALVASARVVTQGMAAGVAGRAARASVEPLVGASWRSMVTVSMQPEGASFVAAIRSSVAIPAAAAPRRERPSGYLPSGLSDVAAFPEAVLGTARPQISAVLREPWLRS